jgi:hypothetical protein
MKSVRWMGIAAVLVVLLPGLLGWYRYFTVPRLPPDQLAEMASSFATLPDDRDAIARACAQLQAGFPFIILTANGATGWAQRNPYAAEIDGVIQLAQDCSAHEPRASLAADFHRVARDLPTIGTPHWYDGRAGLGRIVTLFAVPTALGLAFVTWRRSRRERLILEAA